MKNFEIDDLYTNFEVEFLPHDKIEPGNGITLQVNPDVLTLEFIDDTEKFFRSWSDEQKAKLKKSSKAADAELDISEETDFIFENIKFDIRYKAMILGGLPRPEKAGRRSVTDPDSSEMPRRLIVDWSITRKGEKVPVSFEEISKFSQPLVNKLYEFCREVGRPTKKTDESSAENS